MSTDLEQFAWGKPAEGYAWETAVAIKFPEMMQTGSQDRRDHGETRFLRWRDAQSRGQMLTPLKDEPTLFRTFANLEPNEDAFLRFANQYGWLGVPCLLEDRTEDGKVMVIFGNLRAQGEPYWRWREAHREMQRVSIVLEAILTRDVAKLKQWFHVLPNVVRYEREELYGEALEKLCAPNPELKGWLWKWGNEARDDNERLLRFASGWAQDIINKAMGNSDRGTSTSVRVLMNHVKDGMMMHIVPDTLLAAMWLQCARALTESPTFRACERCGKWFEVSPAARRRNSKYCSDRCKVAAHRARIPLTCDSCGHKFRVAVTVQTGFGYINHQDIACPKCGRTNNVLLPSALREIG